MQFTHNGYYRGSIPLNLILFGYVVPALLTFVTIKVGLESLPLWSVRLKDRLVSFFWARAKQGSKIERSAKDRYYKINFKKLNYSL